MVERGVPEGEQFFRLQFLARMLYSCLVKADDRETAGFYADDRDAPRARRRDLDEITAATGWQPHTVRGAIAGALKKKLGLEVTSEKVDARGRVYRLPAA